MDKIIMALGPAFAAGFAVQRLLEILDPWLSVLPIGNYKQALLAFISALIGVFLTLLSPLSVLGPFGVTNSLLADLIITALVVSAGTEGFNSIIKWLGYAKEDKKAQAALKKTRAAAGINRVDVHDASLMRETRNGSGAPNTTRVQEPSG